MNGTVLGKLTNVFFGTREDRFGLFFTLTGTSCCSSSWACWDPEKVKVSEYTKWSEDSRDKEMVKLMRKIAKLLDDAKVSNIEKLNNIPVQFTFNKGILEDWRVLTEVL